MDRVRFHYRRSGVPNNHRMGARITIIVITNGAIATPMPNDSTVTAGRVGSGGALAGMSGGAGRTAGTSMTVGSADNRETRPRAPGVSERYTQPASGPTASRATLNDGLGFFDRWRVGVEVSG